MTKAHLRRKPVPVRCKGQYSPCELDSLLIPAKIKGMSYEQQCRYVLSPHACHFRYKVSQLYKSMVQANYNINRGSCANPFYVNWQTCKGKFDINGKSLAAFYCHYLGDNRGFSGLIFKIKEWTERQEYVCALKRNGKYCSPGRC